MIVSVKGMVLDKITKQTDKETKHYIRLYQQGEKVNLDVLVPKSIMEQAKLHQDIGLENVQIGIYNVNGRTGMYAKQNF